MVEPSSATDYDSMSLEELMEAKEVAITNLFIERARDIEAIIQARKACDIDGILDAKRQEVIDHITAIYDTYLKACEAVKRGYEEAELNVRERIDSSFQECQRRHIEELVVIEKEYALDIIREKNRPVKEQLQLFEQARRLARINNFEHSIMVREQAKQVFEEEMVVRRQHVEDKYRGIRKVAIERQKTELQLLKKKLVGMLQSVEADCRRDIEGEWRKLSVHLRSFQKRSAVAITKESRFNFYKKKLADGMNQMIQDIAMEITGVPLNSVVIPASPRKEQSITKTPRSTKKSGQTPRSTTTSQRQTPLATPKKTDEPKKSEEPKKETRKEKRVEIFEEEEQKTTSSGEDQSFGLSDISRSDAPARSPRYSVISGEGLPFSDEEILPMDPESD